MNKKRKYEFKRDKKWKKVRYIFTIVLVAVLLLTGIISGINRYHKIKENKAMNAVAQKNPDLGEVTTETKLYFKADTTSKVLYDVPKGTKFTILSTDSNYYMVTFKGTDNKGYMGYILINDTRRISNIERTTKKINLYFKPDTTSKLITTIPEGSRVSYLSRTKEYTDKDNNIYYMISYKGEDGTGYMGYALYEDLMTNETIEKEDETDPTPTPTPTPEPTPTPDSDYNKAVPQVPNISASGTVINALTYSPSVALTATYNDSNTKGFYMQISWNNKTWYNGQNFSIVNNVGPHVGYARACNKDNKCSGVKTFNFYVMNASLKEYATNLEGAATSAMQSFSFYNGNLYITQKTTTGLNGYITGFKKDKKIGSYQIAGAGHMAQIDFDSSGYIWSECAAGYGKSSDFGTAICRKAWTNMKDYTSGSGVFGRLIYVSIGSHTSIAPAIDNAGNRLAVSRTNKNCTRDYAIYDFTKAKAAISSTSAKTADNKHDVAYVYGTAAHGLINHFTVSNIPPGYTPGTDYDKYKDTNECQTSWQGFDIHNNYLYIWEGDPTSSTGPGLKGGYLSIIDTNNVRYLNRYKVALPGTGNWEPEGLEVYNNKLYIGYTKAGSPKKHYIMELQGVI